MINKYLSSTFSGTLELELGDWKENRRYRLLAVDNGILSFVDVDHGNWPVVLITNPKNSNFLAPKVEKVENILASPFVRILAFSPSGISSVRVKLNNEDWKLCQNQSENIFISHWEPEQYSGATNVIRVEVVDGFGDTKEVVQNFVVDQEDIGKLSYSLYARMILMSDPHSLLMFLWLTGFLLCSLPLFLARYSVKSLELLTGGTLAKNLQLVARHKLLYHIYMFTCIFVTFGPWHVGEILSG